MTTAVSLFVTLLCGPARPPGEVSLAQFGSLGWVEILVIFGIIMLLFGARKLPEIGRGLGKAISNFKRSVREEPPKLEEADEDNEDDEGDEEAKPKKSKGE